MRAELSPLLVNRFVVIEERALDGMALSPSRVDAPKLFYRQDEAGPAWVIRSAVEGQLLPVTDGSLTFWYTRIALCDRNLRPIRGNPASDENEVLDAPLRAHIYAGATHGPDTHSPS